MEEESCNGMMGNDYTDYSHYQPLHMSYSESTGYTGYSDKDYRQLVSTIVRGLLYGPQ